MSYLCHLGCVFTFTSEFVRRIIWNILGNLRLNFNSPPSVTKRLSILTSLTAFPTNPILYLCTSHLSAFPLWIFFTLNVWFSRATWCKLMNYVPMIVVTLISYKFWNTIGAIKPGTREPPADYSRMNIPSRTWLHINVLNQQLFIHYCNC